MNELYRKCKTTGETFAARDFFLVLFTLEEKYPGAEVKVKTYKGDNVFEVDIIFNNNGGFGQDYKVIGKSIEPIGQTTHYPTMDLL